MMVTGDGFPDDAVLGRRGAPRGVGRLMALGVMVAGLLVQGCDDTGSEVGRGPTPAASTPAAPALAALAEGSRIPPGRYVVPFEGIDDPLPVARVEIPAGFQMWNESVLWADDDRPSRALMFWTVTGVNPQPCTGPRVYEDPGPSAEDLASAISRQPHRRGPGPRRVTFAGLPALYLELRFDPGFDPERCASGTYEAWQAIGGDGSEDRYQYGRGWVDRIWIIDVADHLLVVNAGHDRRISARDAEALERMLRSVRIDAPS
jgi:hypothetical protein